MSPEEVIYALVGAALGSVLILCCEYWARSPRSWEPVDIVVEPEYSGEEKFLRDKRRIDTAEFAFKRNPLPKAIVRIK